MTDAELIERECDHLIALTGKSCLVENDTKDRAKIVFNDKTLTTYNNDTAFRALLVIQGAVRGIELYKRDGK